jgi:hypothetical protein
MNLSNEMSVTLGDPAIPDSTRMALSNVVVRFNQFAQDLLMQLNARPMIFTSNPATEPDKVKGARKGDISIYTNAQGDVEIVVFQGGVT